MLITSELQLMDDSYLNNTTPQKPYKRILRQHHPIPTDLPHKSPAVPPVDIEGMRRLLTFLTQDCCHGHPEICGDVNIADVFCAEDGG